MLCVCVVFSFIVSSVCASTRLAIPLSLEIFWTRGRLSWLCPSLVPGAFPFRLVLLWSSPLLLSSGPGFGLRPLLVLAQQLPDDHLLSKGWLSAVAVATVEARPAGAFRCRRIRQLPRDPYDKDWRLLSSAAPTVVAVGFHRLFFSRRPSPLLG